MADPHTPDLRQRIAGFTYRSLKWGRDHVPPGLRSVIGVLFMIGGVFGFLPILGFWMLPLGAAFVALDFPVTKHKIEDWMEHLQRTAAGLPPRPSDPRTD